jgi:hypothetical protein
MAQHIDGGGLWWTWSAVVPATPSITGGEGTGRERGRERARRRRGADGRGAPAHPPRLAMAAAPTGRPCLLVPEREQGRETRTIPNHPAGSGGVAGAHGRSRTRKRRHWICRGGGTAVDLERSRRWDLQGSRRLPPFSRPELVSRPEPYLGRRPWRSELALPVPRPELASHGRMQRLCLCRGDPLLALWSSTLLTEEKKGRGRAPPRVVGGRRCWAGPVSSVGARRRLPVAGNRGRHRLAISPSQLATEANKMEVAPRPLATACPSPTA